MWGARGGAGECIHWGPCGVGGADGRRGQMRRSVRAAERKEAAAGAAAGAAAPPVVNAAAAALGLEDQGSMSASEVRRWRLGAPEGRAARRDAKPRGRARARARAPGGGNAPQGTSSHPTLRRMRRLCPHRRHCTGKGRAGRRTPRAIPRSAAFPLLLFAISHVCPKRAVRAPAAPAKRPPRAGIHYFGPVGAPRRAARPRGATQRGAWRAFPLPQTQTQTQN